MSEELHKYLCQLEIDWINEKKNADSHSEEYTYSTAYLNAIRDIRKMANIILSDDGKVTHK